jgi:hypothetical protein
MTSYFDFAKMATKNRLTNDLSARWIAMVLLVAVLFVISGCGQKADKAASTSSTDVTSTAAAPAPAFQPTVAPAAVAAVPGGGADLKDLNHAYIRWIVQSHIRPKTFEEFAAKSKIQFPPAPAGKKYVIDKAGFIAIVSQ